MFDEIVKEMDDLQETYLDRKNDCILRDDIKGADLWHGMAQAVGSCKGIVRNFQTKESQKTPTNKKSKPFTEGARVYSTR